MSEKIYEIDMGHIVYARNPLVAGKVVGVLKQEIPVPEGNFFVVSPEGVPYDGAPIIERIGKTRRYTGFVIHGSQGLWSIQKAPAQQTSVQPAQE